MLAASLAPPVGEAGGRPCRCSCKKVHAVVKLRNVATPKKLAQEFTL